MCLRVFAETDVVSPIVYGVYVMNDVFDYLRRLDYISNCLWRLMLIRVKSFGCLWGT